MYTHNVHIQKEKTVNIRVDIGASSKASVRRAHLFVVTAAVFDERARPSPTGQVTSSSAHGTG